MPFPVPFSEPDHAQDILKSHAAISVPESVRAEFERYALLMRTNVPRHMQDRHNAALQAAHDAYLAKLRKSLPRRFHTLHQTATLESPTEEITCISPTSIRSKS